MTPRDPGVQPERTRLAWSRTSLSFAVCALLLARLALRSDLSVTKGAAIALGVLTWLVFLLVARRRSGALAADTPHAAGGRELVAAAGCVLAMAVYGSVVVL